MSVKAKTPEPDPETVAREEAAAERAEASRLEDLQNVVSADTRTVLRNFGSLASAAGSPSLLPTAVNIQPPSYIRRAGGGFSGIGRGSLVGSRVQR